MGSQSFRQSRQRECILQLLRETDTHPSADWIYAQLKNEFPKLSLGTIYRNITILVEQGLVQKIHFGSTFDRFEANPTSHYHLICESCGKIEDFHMPVHEDLNREACDRSGYSIHRHMIEFYGLCLNCRES